MCDFILTTFDWVPNEPRGYIRDIRVRWALEEAGFSYRVETVPFKNRNPNHFSRQPFGQVPWLTDGDRTIFESGAIVFHLGERSELLLPADPAMRGSVIQWVFAALNSVEMASLPWSLFEFADVEAETQSRKQFDEFLKGRLTRMDAVLADREWLTPAFSVADILMADVLRLVDRFGGLAEYAACRGYVARATARPAFTKAYADQLAHFAKAN